MVSVANIPTFETFDLVPEGLTIKVERQAQSTGPLGPTFAATVVQVEDGAWDLELPKLSPWELHRLDALFQRTAKGTLPMRWAPMGGIEEAVTFAAVGGLSWARESGNTYRASIRLERWHG